MSCKIHGSDNIRTQVSKSAKNPGRAYYTCTDCWANKETGAPAGAGNFSGWVDEAGSATTTKTWGQNFSGSTPAYQGNDSFKELHSMRMRLDQAETKIEMLTAALEEKFGISQVQEYIIKDSVDADPGFKRSRTEFTATA